MNNLLFSRLAVDNIRKNKNTYLPYILSSILMISLFYILHNITEQVGQGGFYGGRNMKIRLKNINDRSHMEDHKNLLVDFLEQDGYSIGKVSFHSEEEIDLLGLEESSQTKKSISDSNLDLKI